MRTSIAESKVAQKMKLWAVCPVSGLSLHIEKNSIEFHLLKFRDLMMRPLQSRRCTHISVSNVRMFSIIDQELKTLPDQQYLRNWINTQKSSIIYVGIEGITEQSFAHLWRARLSTLPHFTSRSTMREASWRFKIINWNSLTVLITLLVNDFVCMLWCLCAIAMGMSLVRNRREEEDMINTMGERGA